MKTKMAGRQRNDSEATLAAADKWSNLPTSISYFRRLRLNGSVTQDVAKAKYDGAGTQSDPYIISFLDNDPGDPKQFSRFLKWQVVAGVSFVTFIASLTSSIYVGAQLDIQEHFNAAPEVVTVGLSLFVLGLAMGPLLWAPLGEVIGRQITLCISTAGFTIFNGGVTAAQNIQTLLVLRYFAGAFASAPFTNASGNLADCFEPAQRGLAFGFYAITPFMGPVLGPMIGGFLSTAASWRWVMGLATILSFMTLLFSIFVIPETFGATILKRRAKTLSQLTGNHYISALEYSKGPTKAVTVFKTAITRPWAILFLEPIVLSLSTWISLVYGTLYLLLAGFPFVFEDARGWSPGVSGLALLGIAVGTLLAAAVNIPINKRYAIIAKKDKARPEVRLQPAMVAGLIIPAGLFWFAFTSPPSIPWIVPIIGSSLFGFGLVIIWTSVNNYLVDSYKVYAASALAGQVVWRSIFGAVFPLFTRYMYQNLGLQWAGAIPAFLALACSALPFIFYVFGEEIRNKSRFIGQAEADTRKLNEATRKEKPKPKPKQTKKMTKQESRGNDSNSTLTVVRSRDDRDGEKTSGRKEEV